MASQHMVGAVWGLRARGFRCRLRCGLMGITGLDRGCLHRSRHLLGSRCLPGSRRLVGQRSLHGHRRRGWRLHGHQRLRRLSHRRRLVGSLDWVIVDLLRVIIVVALAQVRGAVVHLPWGLK